MILLAALLATPLAPGCQRLERAVLCELAPPIRIAPPAAPPTVAAEALPPRPGHRRPAGRSSPKPPPPPPATDEIARRVASLVAIADCTGARTLLATTGSASAAADATYRACVGMAPAEPSSGRDLQAVPAETTTALGGAEIVKHPQ